MGLDTSHDCFHSSYSTFMEWRCWLHARITGEPASRSNLDRAWESGRYEDQTVPINVLMAHSDCDGEIAAKDCEPLAHALEVIVAKKGPRHVRDEAYMVETTKRFIAGLRRAASAGEPVDFH